MQRPVTRAQNVSRGCLVCGRANSAGLHASFYELADGRLVGRAVGREEHQGYPGRLHGGMASALLDETIGRAITLTEPDAWGVTVELNVRFRKPVPLGCELRAVARITRDSSRLFEGTGELLLPDGTVAVEARGKYMKLPIAAIAGVDFDTTQWFADEAPVPDSIDVP